MVCAEHALAKMRRSYSLGDACNASRLLLVALWSITPPSTRWVARVLVSMAWRSSDDNFSSPPLFSLIHLKRYVGIAKWPSIIYLYRILFIYLLVSSLNIWFFYVFLIKFNLYFFIPIYFVFNLFLLILFFNLISNHLILILSFF